MGHLSKRISGGAYYQIWAYIQLFGEFQGSVFLFSGCYQKISSFIIGYVNNLHLGGKRKHAFDKEAQSLISVGGGGILVTFYDVDSLVFCDCM